MVMVVAFASLLFMTASAPAEVFFAKDFLEVGDAGFGALWTSWFAGMAVGGLLLARRFHRAPLAGAALVAIVVQSIGLAAPTLPLVFIFALACYVVGGAAHGTKNVLIRTLLHQRVPARLHGRAFAAYNALRNGAEIVALVLGGLLIAAIGGSLDALPGRSDTCNRRCGRARRLPENARRRGESSLSRVSRARAR